MGPVTRSWLAVPVVVAVAATAGWLAVGAMADRTRAARIPPLADLAGTPQAARAAIEAAHDAALDRPSAPTVGALGQAYQAAQLPEPALAAYALAEAWAPNDWVWTYHRALVLEERGDARTRDALVRVTSTAPDFGLAWYRLAEWHFKHGRLDDASPAYERAAAAPAPVAFLPPGVQSRQTSALSAYAQVGLARVALERGDRDGAVRRLRAVVDGAPGFGPARTLLRAVGDAAAPSAAPRRAGSAFVPPADPILDALVATSQHSDVLLKYAGQAARAGDGAWREYLVRRALAASPDDLNVLLEMAALLHAMGRPAEALEHLQRHERLAPGDHHGLVEQGRALMDLGRLTDAEAVLRRAVTVRDAAAEYNLASTLDRQNRWDEARPHYDRALAIDPFHVRAMNNLGVGLDRRGQSAAALAWFEKAIAISPDSPEFYVNYGSALIQLRRFDDAATALTTAVGLDPRDANAYNNLGIALAQAGDLPRALAEFERALQIDPRHENARLNLDRVRAALGS